MGFNHYLSYIYKKESMPMKLHVPLFTIGQIGIILLLFVSCYTAGNTSTADEKDSSTQKHSLIEYLRQIPSLNIMGSGSNVHVTVRGNRSFTGPNSPLYVINGVQVGHSFSEAESMVSIYDVKSVRLLNDREAMGRFGQSAGFGVIEILTE